MKITYCVTKYNPKYRNIYGGYERDEWTEVGDIGKKFHGQKFNQSEYLKTENNYLKAVELIAENEDFLTITKLEKRSDLILHKNLPLSNGEVDFYNKICNRKKLNPFQAIVVSKLILRNELWAVLKSKNVEIEFGYDFYMYFIVDKPIESEILSKIESFDLFIQKIE